MHAKRLPQSVRKHIRKEKAQIRRRFFADEEQQQAALAKLRIKHYGLPQERTESPLQEQKKTPIKKEQKGTVKTPKRKTAKKTKTKVDSVPAV